MKKSWFIIVLFLLPLFSINCQTRSELEELRKKNLAEIEYVDQLLKSTATQRDANVTELKAIGRKLRLREKLISEYGQEIDLLEVRINLNRMAGEMLQADLDLLKDDYARSIVSAFRADKGIPAIAFILSSGDFNQGYMRLRYIQKVARYRRFETETIEAVWHELNRTNERLEQDRRRVNDLKGKEIKERHTLSQEQKKRTGIITSLGQKEKQLKQELDEKRRIARQIEREIERLIEEERNRSGTEPMSSEMKLIGDDFGENRGRLPWPVDKGFISSHFGSQPHAVLKNVIEDNIGIEITSAGKTLAKAVFKGEVVRVFAISGSNMAIIVRHGKYLTVYQDVVNVRVKAGEKVVTGQVLGDVYFESSNGGRSVLKFMVYEERKKINPELWLIKK